MSIQHCDYGHFVNKQVRLLPWGKGDLGGNSIVCKTHYDQVMRERREEVEEGKIPADNPAYFPAWHNLEVYRG